MEKTTQREIKRLIKLGAAIELTDTKAVKYSELRTVAMSFGIYGMNGALFQHETTGQLYAIPSRSTLLFYYA
ncbi:MAG: hypothetical protein K2O88_06725 [Paramuribaculum sp.]|nr:hypothetical protein [Paramuribaculum sp.]